MQHAYEAGAPTSSEPQVRVVSDWPWDESTAASRRSLGWRALVPRVAAYTILVTGATGILVAAPTAEGQMVQRVGAEVAYVPARDLVAAWSSRSSDPTASSNSLLTREPSWYADHVGIRLAEFEQLPVAWDGGHGIASTSAAVARTLSVLAKLMSGTRVPPQLFPLWDGGIQIEWHAAGNVVSVEVGGTGSSHVLATRSDGSEVAVGDMATAGDDSQTLAAATFLRELSDRFLPLQAR
jgi:hypothetical protein